MLHAAAMLIGLFLLAVLASQRVISVEDAALAAAVALVCTAATLRLGGVARNPFSDAPQFIALAVTRIATTLRGGLRVMRTAAAADVTVKPALVQVKTHAATGYASAAFADAIGGEPGTLLVDADADGLLVHVMDEDSVDAARLGALEGRVLAAFDARSRR